MSIENSLIRRQILNQRFARGLGNRYGDQLNSTINRVASRLAREPNNARLQNTLTSLLQIVNRDLAEFKLNMLDDLTEFAVDEADLLGRIMADNTTAILRVPSAEAVEKALNSNEIDLPVGPTSVTLGEALDNFNASQALNIRTVIQDSFLLGDPLNVTVAKLREFSDGRPRAQIESLSRTLTNFASSQARRQFAEENKAVFDGEEWIAVLDSRTTLICGGRDGKVYPVGSGPYPPAHWNCRSVRVPVLQKDFQSKTQKSNREDFDTWLRDQDADFQDEYFSQFPDGLQKAKLFREGELKLERFRDEVGREYTIDQLRQLNPLAFDRSDLTDRVSILPTSDILKPKNFDKAEKSVKEWVNKSFTTTDYNRVLTQVETPVGLNKPRGGAYYENWTGGINMGDKKTDSPGGRNTYRHEFGHHVDYTLTPGKLRSSQQDFIDAMTSSRNLATDHDKALLAQYKRMGLTSRRRGYNAIREISGDQINNIYVDLFDMDSATLTQWISDNIPTGTMQRSILDNAGLDGVGLKQMSARLKHSLDMNSEYMAIQSVWNDRKAWLKINNSAPGFTGVLDNVFALSKNWGGGHLQSYYKQRFLAENKEIFANTFAAMDPETSKLTLDLYRALMPDLYDKMKEIIKL